MKSATTTQLLCVSVLLTGLIATASADDEKPYGIVEYVPLTTSRVVSSPDPPLPYRVVRMLPKLEVEWPIFVTTEPGSSRLIFIHYHRAEKKFRICRTKNDRSTGKFDVLF